MTTCVLIGGDTESEVKLIEAKLSAEYFDVAVTSSGDEILARIHDEAPDIVLLDADTPNLNAFDVCRRIKADVKSKDVPVAIMISATQSVQRALGLDAGTDDFLTKPVDDMSLFARVRSLVRLKMMTDEVRAREETGQSLGFTDASETRFEADPTGSILIVEDRPESVTWLRSALEAENKVADIATSDEALVNARGGDFDLIIVSLSIRAFDSLRLCSQLRSVANLRNMPILVLVSVGENQKLAKALDIGVNDYLTRFIDCNEVLARVRTQLRRKHCADKVRTMMQRVFELAATNAHAGKTASGQSAAGPVSLESRVATPSVVTVSPAPVPDSSLLTPPIVALKRKSASSGSILQTVKSFGTVMLGVAIFIGVMIVAPLFLLIGGGLAAIAIYPYLIAVTQYVLPICGMILVPLTAFNRTRMAATTNSCVPSATCQTCDMASRSGRSP